MIIPGKVERGVKAGLAASNQLDVAIDNLKGYGNQGLPATGAGDTSAILDNKQGAVVGALDHGVAGIKKLIFNPLQGDTHMRALVAVEITTAALFDHQKRIIAKAKAFAARVGQRIDMTQAM
jgi:hypothetical protein